MLSLTLHNDLAALTSLPPFVGQIAAAYDIPSDVAFQLQLALDESLANVVQYAYPGLTGQPVTLQADVEADAGRRTLVLRIIDQGIPFDPLSQAPDVDTSLPAEQRPIGGLGIFLVRQMTDELTYHRLAESNILTLKKHL